MTGPNVSTIASLTVLILTFLLACCVLWSTLIKARDRSKFDKEGSSRIYEDEDGVATEESQKHQSVSTPRWISLSACFVGFSVSIFVAILGATNSFGLSAANVENWLALGSWVSRKPQTRVAADKGTAECTSFVNNLGHLSASHLDPVQVWNRRCNSSGIKLRFQLFPDLHFDPRS